MSGPEVQELVTKGISALKAGQRTEARNWLAEAVQQDPRNEQAWLYLAGVLPRSQAIVALKRVLALNPDNQFAQRGLAAVQNKPGVADNAAADSGTLEPNPGNNPSNQPPPEEPRPSSNPNRLRVEELPMTDREQPDFFEMGYRPVEIDREGREANSTKPNLKDSQALLPPIVVPDEEDELRVILSQAYSQTKRRRVSPLLVGLLLLLPILIIGGLVYFLVLKPPPTRSPAPTLPVVTTQAAFTPSVSNLEDPATAIAALPTSDAALALPTNTPAPTTPAALKLSISQNERAALRGYAVMFSNFDRRSNNFSFGGAGTPKANTHFEGVLVDFENISSRVLPVQSDNFQAVDGRSNFLKPLNGGRAPALDVSRLQPGEKRQAWLTFEVEDGTTLRRVAFNPTAAPDLNNSAEVNLTLPVATPVPTIKPTVRPTATPIPTTTPRPTSTPAPTSTPVPTATPIPTNTAIVAASPGAFSAPVAVAPTLTPIPISTTIPIATLTVDATQDVATPTIEATTPAVSTVAATVAVSPTPFPTTPTLQGEVGKRSLIGSYGISVTNYVVSATIKPPPLILPAGYHYETVKITVEVTDGKDVADYLNSFPFLLRDSDGQLYSVGPYTLEAKDGFSPKTFAPTTTAPGKTKATGTLYFLVRDAARNQPRSLLFYATPDLDSPRLEIPLKTG